MSFIILIITKYLRLPVSIINLIVCWYDFK